MGATSRNEFRKERIINSVTTKKGYIEAWTNWWRYLKESKLRGWRGITARAS